MSRNDSPPFARGETYYNDPTVAANAANDPLGLGGVNLEGREYLFEVNDPDNYLQNDPSGRQVRVRVTRNNSTIALKPGRLIRANLGNAKPIGTSTDGYTTGEADVCLGVVDEALPAAGVPVNDLFYAVVEGPTKVTSKSASMPALAQGDKLIPATGTSSVSADAGLVDKYPVSPTVLDGISIVGRADVALTSGTNSTQFAAVVGRGFAR